MLNVDPTATPLEIRKAYRAAARRAHPDKGGAKERFCQITRAFGVLSCPVARILYDRSSAFKQEPAGLGQSCASSSTAAPASPSTSTTSMFTPFETRLKTKAKPTMKTKSDPSLCVGNALQRLCSLLREMDTHSRLTALRSMSQHSRVALLAFMERALKDETHGSLAAAEIIEMQTTTSLPDHWGRAVSSLERALKAQELVRMKALIKSAKRKVALRAKLQAAKAKAAKARRRKRRTLARKAQEKKEKGKTAALRNYARRNKSSRTASR